MKFRNLLRETQYLLEYLLLAPVVWLIRRARPRVAAGIGWVVAEIAHAVLVNDREWCRWNLELVYAERLTPKERRAMTRRIFHNIVRSRIELLRFTHEWMLENVVEVNGEEARETMRRAQAAGTGIILATIHLGNFELLAPWIYHTGFHGPVMYRPLNNWRVEKLMLGARGRYLPELVRRGTGGVMSFLYALREKLGVGILIDMNTLQNPVFVDVLGFPAASPPGAAALSLGADAPVLLAVAVRQPDGKHHLVFEPPMYPIRTGNRRRDIELNTQRYMRRIDEYVLAYPEQYNWPHPRWRLRPDGSFWKRTEPAASAARERRSPPPLCPTPLPERIDDGTVARLHAG